VRRSTGHSMSANARDSSSVYKRLAGFRTHQQRSRSDRGTGALCQPGRAEVQRATVYNVTNFFGWVSTAASWRARFTLSEQHEGCGSVTHSGCDTVSLGASLHGL